MSSGGNQLQPAPNPTAATRRTGAALDGFNSPNAEAYLAYCAAFFQEDDSEEQQYINGFDYDNENWPLYQNTVEVIPADGVGSVYEVTAEEVNKPDVGAGLWNLDDCTLSSTSV
ncbi:uncharacterized protein MYCGRDRAFT_93619 [Zymoseptoria tritici IPO323]|uniref:Uncharacterized protein n=1 Tax=Zymoseptoria tritici (strain CBS 115943 / IPO323) TaxID=336722 RepID=F9XE40_ZYMTI|nr:uncharacterized protein MYCGRDRAFT_93619 [Zymoseptoria tritici IPO323]EGP86974.1 hypothetical protein MYCGRDRAFT_93619 [Zymoseptoria tritici IPO323]